jgi:HD-GYP domain-containing protein (c-di-GMP phosphodiesterase class II)
LVSELASDREPIRHATNVTFLAIQIGLRIGDYLVHSRSRVGGRRARNLVPLGLGAMLHDVGMLRVSDEVRERWIETGVEDGGEHTIGGYRMVQGRVPSAAAITILDHHQRQNGSGFPRRKSEHGLKRAPAGDEIHVFARIVAVADAFDARSRSVDEGGLGRVAALRSVYRDSAEGLFDPVVALGLLATSPAFVPGSLVTLSDGRRAVVLSWDVLDPCRPVVRTVDLDRFESGDMDADEGERIDLRVASRLRIIESGGMPVEDDLFYPTHAGQFDLDARLRTLYRADAA